MKQGLHFHAAGSQTLLFIWQKQGGTDHFKDLRLKHRLMQVRNLCRNPCFNEGSNSPSQKNFDILILETLILAAQILISRQESKQGAECDCE